MFRLFKELCCHLKVGRPAVLASIVGQAGSTPRTPGTRMAVLPDGSILGTIGGGRLEAEVMALARPVLAEGLARMVRFDLSGADAAGMDMICGGKMTILLEPLSPDAETLQALRGFASDAGSKARGFFVSELEPAPGQEERFVARQRFVLSRQNLSRLLAQAVEEAASERCPVLVGEGGRYVVAEPTPRVGTVWLLGAGHVSQRTAALAAQVDFRVVVADDRSEFANRKRFPMADKILVPERFDDFLAPQGLGADDYVVIVTRGHQFDGMLLEQALRTEAGYLGMIGSRRKRDAIYDMLREKGFGDADFERVYSPIGLDIGAETPEEIAVSIVAELIKARVAGLWPRRGVRRPEKAAGGLHAVQV